MQALEMETVIDQDGTVHLPKRFQKYFGKHARVIVLLPDYPSTQKVNIMKYSGKVDWPVDGMALQKELRDEWK